MIEEIAKLLFWMVFEVLFLWTGEVVLYIVTLGRRRPRWNLHANKESASKSFVFAELSLWIGIAFWLIVAVLVYKLFATG